MKVVTNKKRIEEIFNRGIIVEYLPSKEEVVKQFSSGERLRIYIGVDPTSDNLHLSHAKNFMLLEEFRQLGHEVIALIGDFTARIGDPAGKSAARKQLTKTEVERNVRSWLSQIKPFLNFKGEKNPPLVLYNSKWLSKLSFEDVILLASHFTVQRMIERDMFEKRLENNIPIYLHEFFYPLMQGYDSVAMEVDVELCGTDQTFNALAGRTLLKKLKNKDKSVIVVNLMANPKTGELMSKSKGTGVFLSSPPDKMYGAIMAQPDEMTKVFFINLTRIPLSEIDKIMLLGPREAKARVAYEIVGKIYGKKEAKQAQEIFEKTFSKKELADAQLPKLRLSKKRISVLDLVLISRVAKSKSEARRLTAQGAVEIDGIIKKGLREVVGFRGGEVLKIGKKNFFQIMVKQ